MVVRYVSKNSFLPLLSLYISLFYLYLFRRFVGCASGCLAFWVTGAISFSSAYSGAYWFSSWQTGFLYGMFVFSRHLSGLIFRVRGSVGQVVGFSVFLPFFRLPPYTRLRLILTPLGDYFYHCKYPFHLLSSCFHINFLQNHFFWKDQLALLYRCMTSNITFPSLLLPLLRDDHFLSLTCFMSYILSIYPFFFFLYPWYIAFWGFLGGAGWDLLR